MHRKRSLMHLHRSSKTSDKKLTADGFPVGGFPFKSGKGGALPQLFTIHYSPFIKKGLHETV